MSGGDDGVICMWDLRQKHFATKVRVETKKNSIDALTIALFRQRSLPRK